MACADGSVNGVSLCHLLKKRDSMMFLQHLL